MDALARHRTLQMLGVPVVAMRVPPRVELRDEPVDDELDEDESEEDFDEEEIDDEESDEDLEDDESEDEDDDESEEDPVASARHRSLQLLGVEVRARSNPAPGRQVGTAEGARKYGLPIGATIPPGMRALTALQQDAVAALPEQDRGRYVAARREGATHAAAMKAARPASAKAPAKRAPAFDAAEVAGRIASQKTEAGVIKLLSGDPTLTAAKLRKVAEHLGIDVPDNVRAKSALQLLIAENEANERNLPGGFDAPATATKTAPRKGTPERSELVERLADKYESGQSLQEIADSEGFSASFVHDVLVKEAAVQLRQRGGVKKAGKKVAASPDETSPTLALQRRIRDAYAELALEPGAWVALRRLRQHLHDVPRADLDEALRKLNKSPEILLEPEPNQKTLKAADWAAAIFIGGEDRHLLAVDLEVVARQERAALAATKAAAPAKKAAPRRLSTTDASVQLAADELAAMVADVERLADAGASNRAVVTTVRARMRRHRLQPVDASGADLTGTSPGRAVRYEWRRPDGALRLEGPPPAGMSAGELAEYEAAQRLARTALAAEAAAGTADLAEATRRAAGQAAPRKATGPAFLRTAAAAKVDGQDRTVEVVHAAALLDRNESQTDRVRRQRAGNLADTELQAIGRMQGFDAPPTVGSQAQVDAAVAAGWVELWRGSSAAGDLSPADTAERFRTGDYAPGFGEYGNGYYTTVDRDRALIYTAPEQFPPFTTQESGLLRMALNPDARVLDVDDPATALRELQAESGLDPADRGPAGRVLGDLGHLAAAQGYDAIVVRGRPAGGGGDDSADQYVILNRSAVIVQEATPATRTPADTVAAIRNAMTVDEAKAILGTASQRDLDALAAAAGETLWPPTARTLTQRRDWTITTLVGKSIETESTRYAGKAPDQILPFVVDQDLRPGGYFDNDGRLRRLGLTREMVEAERQRRERDQASAGPSRQARIDAGRRVGEALSEVDELVDGAATPEAIQRRLASRLNRGAGLTDDQAQRLTDAATSGDRQRLSTVLDEIAAEHGLTRVSGQAGDVEPYRSGMHRSLDTSSDPRGKMVEVIRPGYAINVEPQPWETRDPSTPLTIVPAVVYEATPEQTAAAQARQARERQAASPVTGDLSAMTVSQLRTLARERGITIPAGARKADIIRLLGGAPATPTQRQRTLQLMGVLPATPAGAAFDRETAVERVMSLIRSLPGGGVEVDDAGIRRVLANLMPGDIRAVAREFAGFPAGSPPVGTPSDQMLNWLIAGLRLSRGVRT